MYLGRAKVSQQIGNRHPSPAADVHGVSLALGRAQCGTQRLSDERLAGGLDVGWDGVKLGSSSHLLETPAPKNIQQASKLQKI